MHYLMLMSPLLWQAFPHFTVEGTEVWEGLCFTQGHLAREHGSRFWAQVHSSILSTTAHLQHEWQVCSEHFPPSPSLPLLPTQTAAHITTTRTRLPSRKPSPLPAATSLTPSLGLSDNLLKSNKSTVWPFCVSDEKLKSFFVWSPAHFLMERLNMDQRASFPLMHSYLAQTPPPASVSMALRTLVLIWYFSPVPSGPSCISPWMTCHWDALCKQPGPSVSWALNAHFSMLY